MIQALKIELYRDTVGDWHWRTRCPENGNVLGCSSEGYTHKDHTIRMIVRHFGADAQYDEVAQ